MEKIDASVFMGYQHNFFVTQFYEINHYTNYSPIMMMQLLCCKCSGCQKLCILGINVKFECRVLFQTNDLLYEKIEILL